VELGRRVHPPITAQNFHTSDMQQAISNARPAANPHLLYVVRPSGGFVL